MNYAYFISFFLLFWSASTALFSHNSHDEAIVECAEYLQIILAEAPEIIKKYDSDKFYLDESRIISNNEEISFIKTNKKDIPLHRSLIFSDHNGKYLSYSKEILAKKMFKHVCNDCDFEWEGGAFTFRCPNCRSTDISNVPNW